MAKKLMTVAEVMAYTGLSRYSLGVLVRAGKLPFLRVGNGRGRLYFDKDLIDSRLKEIASENADDAAAEYEKNSEEFSPVF